MLVEYSSNNSGGEWWLSDDDWIALEKDGWHVKWGGIYFCHSDSYINRPPEGKHQPCATKEECKGHRKFDSPTELGRDRFLGALATYAEKETDNIKSLLQEFEAITGQDVSDEGCNCCGAPHSFSWYDDDGDYHYASGVMCLEYLYDDVPSNMREAVNRLNSNRDES